MARLYSSLPKCVFLDQSLINEANLFEIHLSIYVSTDSQKIQFPPCLMAVLVAPAIPECVSIYRCAGTKLFFDSFFSLLHIVTGHFPLGTSFGA